MAPGITGGTSGRPRPAPLIRHFACLVPKNQVPISIYVGLSPPLENVEPTKCQGTAPPLGPYRSAQFEITTTESSDALLPLSREGSFDDATTLLPLIALCFARSGDKGDVTNIGVIARKPAFYPFLSVFLTEQMVAHFLAHLAKGETRRYQLPGLFALNFVLTKSLGGGGLGSLQIDRQGKSYAQILLTLTVHVPNSLLPFVSERAAAGNSALPKL